MDAGQLPNQTAKMIIKPSDARLWHDSVLHGEPVVKGTLRLRRMECNAMAGAALPDRHAKHQICAHRPVAGPNTAPAQGVSVHRSYS